MLLLGRFILLILFFFHFCITGRLAFIRVFSFRWIL
jgi:hypothetical protein